MGNIRNDQHVPEDSKIAKDFINKDKNFLFREQNIIQIYKEIETPNGVKKIHVERIDVE